MIEKEIKILLSQAEYDMLCETFKEDRVIVQRNNYYSCEKSKELTASIRIREIGNDCFLQVKTPIKTEGSLSVKHEFELKVSAVTDTIDAEILTKLTNIDFGNAKLIGALETRRRLTLPDSETEICLDKNMYLGKTDYELEIEYTGEYPQKLVDLLKEKGISAEKSTKGKFARFLQAAENK